MKEPDYGSYIPRGGIVFPGTLGACALALRVLKQGGMFVFSDLFRKGRYRYLAVLTDRLDKEVKTLEVEEASDVEGLRIDRFSRKNARVLSGRK